MKAYILDSIERFKRFSQNLDVKAIICNKSWKVFNDEGVAEIYVFNDDGSMIISHNGKVTNSKWKYVPATASLVIDTPSQSYMLKPTFLFGRIFALQLYGVEQYAFLIEENNSKNFQPKTLTELNAYLLEIVAKKERERMLLNDQKKKEAQNAFYNRKQSELESQFRVEWRTSSKGIIWFSVTFLLWILVIISLALSYANSNLQVFLTFAVIVFFVSASASTLHTISLKSSSLKNFYKKNGLPEKYWYL